LIGNEYRKTKPKVCPPRKKIPFFGPKTQKADSLSQKRASTLGKCKRVPIKVQILGGRNLGRTVQGVGGV